jgi:hypothetical protein
VPCETTCTRRCGASGGVSEFVSQHARRCARQQTRHQCAARTRSVRSRTWPQGARGLPSAGPGSAPRARRAADLAAEPLYPSQDARYARRAPQTAAAGGSAPRRRVRRRRRRPREARQQGRGRGAWLRPARPLAQPTAA